MASGYTATLPSDVLIDSGVLYVGSALWGASVGGLKFSPTRELRNVQFDGKRSEHAGLDRFVSYGATLTGNMIEFGPSQIPMLENALTATGGPLPTPVIFTPRQASGMLAVVNYLTDVYVYFDRISGGKVRIHFRYAKVTTWSLEGADKAEGLIGIEIVASNRIGLSGITTDDAPYEIELSTDGTFPVSGGSLPAASLRVRPLTSRYTPTAQVGALASHYGNGVRDEGFGETVHMKNATTPAITYRQAGRQPPGNTGGFGTAPAGDLTEFNLNHSDTDPLFMEELPLLTNRQYPGDGPVKAFNISNAFNVYQPLDFPFTPFGSAVKSVWGECWIRANRPQDVGKILEACLYLTANPGVNPSFADADRKGKKLFTLTTDWQLAYTLDVDAAGFGAVWMSIAPPENTDIVNGGTAGVYPLIQWGVGDMQVNSGFRGTALNRGSRDTIHDSYGYWVCPRQNNQALWSHDRSHVEWVKTCTRAATAVAGLDAGVMGTPNLEDLTWATGQVCGQVVSDAATSARLSGTPGPHKPSAVWLHMYAPTALASDFQGEIVGNGGTFSAPAVGPDEFGVLRCRVPWNELHSSDTATSPTVRWKFIGAGPKTIRTGGICIEWEQYGAERDTGRFACVWPPRALGTPFDGCSVETVIPNAAVNFDRNQGALAFRIRLPYNPYNFALETDIDDRFFYIGPAASSVNLIEVKIAKTAGQAHGTLQVAMYSVGAARGDESSLSIPLTAGLLPANQFIDIGVVWGRATTRIMDAFWIRTGGVTTKYTDGVAGVTRGYYIGDVGERAWQFKASAYFGADCDKTAAMCGWFTSINAYLDPVTDGQMATILDDLVLA